MYQQATRKTEDFLYDDDAVIIKDNDLSTDTPATEEENFDDDTTFLPRTLPPMEIDTDTVTESEKIPEPQAVPETRPLHSELPATNASVGVRLRTARENKGFSVQEMADRLYLEKRIVEGLESDDYQRLPPPAFVQGYIRNYAKALELPPDPFVQAFLQAATHNNDHPPLVYDEPGDVPDLRASTGDLWFKIVAAVLIILGIGLMAMWWNSDRLSADLLGIGGEQTETSTNTDVTETPSEDQIDTSETPDGFTPPAEGDDSPLGEGSLENGTLETDTPPVEPDLTPVAILPSEVPPEEPAPVEPEHVSNQLVLRFKGDCWTQVIDSTDKKLHVSTGGDGKEVILKGTPPFKITLGRPNAVKEMLYAGKPVNLSPYGGSVARFTVP